MYEGVVGAWANGAVDTNWGLFQEKLTGEIHLGAVPLPGAFWMMSSVLIVFAGFKNYRKSS